MDKALLHKGYTGSVEVSLEDECLHGRVLFVTDLITYEGATVQELEASFKSAVDRYLEHCKRVGKQPDKSCSGNLNVRLGVELHRQAATAAVHAGCSLNDFVVKAVEAAVDPAEPRRVLHEHVLVGERVRDVGPLTASSSAGGVVWEDHVVTH